MKHLLPILLLALASALPGAAQTAASDTCIVVLPGGSYCWHDMKTEGRDVAAYFRAQGYDAVVLKYPVQGIPAYVTHYRLIFRGHKYPDALNALNAEVQRQRQTHRVVGVVGFSAGGHLALMASGVDFIGAIYPVVTMRPPYAHKRSRRALLGEYGKFSRTLRDSLSLELHADRIAAPVFLLNCKDDPVVKYQNSVLLDSALTAARRPHVYRQYPQGGHGFGLTKHNWGPEFLRWIRQKQ